MFKGHIRYDEEIYIRDNGLNFEDNVQVPDTMMLKMK